MRPRLMAALASLSVACAASPPPPPNDAQELSRLQQATAKRENLVARLSSTPPELRQQCDVSDGECMLLVREKREELVRAQFFPKCKAKAAGEQREQCEEQQLAEAGKANEVADYYEMHVWCINTLLECVSKLEQQATTVAKQERYEQRKQSIESTPAATALRAGVDVAATQVDFVRSTLPPALEEACLELPEAATCQQQVQQHSETYKAELGKDEGAYAEQQAAQWYELAKRTEASCFQPELDCLVKATADYGASAETRQHLKRNLELIEQRQRLLAKLPDAAGQGCLQQGIARHQSQVAEKYGQYTRRPIAYFYVQLHRTFANLHQWQVRCLQKLAR